MSGVELALPEEVFDRLRAGEDVGCYPTLTFRDRRAEDVEIRLHDDLPVDGFCRRLLRSLYELPLEAPFLLPDPIEVVAVEDGQRHDRLAGSHAVVGTVDGDRMRVAVTVDDDVERPRGSAPEVRWRPERFRVAVSVPVGDYLGVVLPVARRCLEAVEASDRPASSGRRIERLLADGRRLDAHLDATGTVAGFALPTDRVEGALYRTEHCDDRLARLLVESGAVADELDRLRSREDDETVGRRYRALLDHPSRAVRTATAEALAERPDDRAVEALLERRWGDDPEVVVPALRAAGRVGGPEVREALVDSLDVSGAPAVRLVAVEQLRRFDDEAVVEALETATTDDSEDVREAAREALADRR